MKNRKELIKIIENKFSNMMVSYGFSKKFSSHNIIKRKTVYGHDSIHFIYKSYPDSICLLVGIGIRYDNIIEYMGNILSKPGYFTPGNDNTIMGHYLHVFSNKLDELEIYTEDDIDRVLNDIYKDIIKYAFPFYDKYSNIHEVYKYSLDDKKPLHLILIR